MTAPVVESFATTAPGGGGTTVTCNAPASIAVGDLLVAFVSGSFVSGTPGVSLTGWTLHTEYNAAAQHLAILSKVAASEPGSYEFGLGESLSSRRVAILRISGAGGVNVTPSQNSGSGTTATGTAVTTTEDDCLVLLGVRWGANSDSFTPSNTAVLNINRLGVGRNNQATAGSTGSITATITSGSWLASIVAIEPLSAPINQPPTITANTADEATLSTLAQLEFTGEDNEDDDLRYQVQVSDTPAFIEGVNETSELLSGSGTIIHPNPVGGTTWEGHRQVDDRLGMSFQGRGGFLDSVDFYFGAHETLPEHTDGHYLARVYAATGYPVDPVPPAWQATTVYSAGDIVRPTSTANANVHFVYRCKNGGTSHSVEPSWPGNGGNWQSVTELGETSDGTVTWETLAGMHPVDPADEAATPTPGWLAQSVVYAYAPGSYAPQWHTLEFTGASRIRLENGTWYIVILDWRPVNTTTTNTLAIQNASLANATSPGNVYLDGPGTNNGPRIIDDAWHVIREEFILIDATSGTDDGFANTETPADTDPFTAGEMVRYTVQAGDELEDGATYFWRVRASDPGGSTAWSDWSAVRTFVVGEDTTNELTADGLTTGAPIFGATALGQVHELTADGLATGAAIVGVAVIGQVHELTADDLAAGAPIFGVPALVENPPDVDILTADGLTTGAPIFGATAFGQVHELTADGLATGAAIVGVAVIGQTHIITTAGITTGGPVLGSPGQLVYGGAPIGAYVVYTGQNSFVVRASSDATIQM